MMLSDAFHDHDREMVAKTWCSAQKSMDPQFFKDCGKATHRHGSH